jgi:hypothetical protein
LKHQDQYLRNVTQNLMTYALGRGVEYGDMPAVRSVLHTAASDGYRLKSLIEAIALSDNFCMNVAPATDTAPAVDTPGKSRTAAVLASGRSAGGE